ncbi:hypothetical protein KR044_004255, partial [Drosophila immigrans]
SPIANKCNRHEEITQWINEQVVRNAKLTRFNLRLKEILDNVNDNKTTSLEKGHCCFYEANTMNKVFADITTLSQKYNIDGGAGLQTTGDMGKDLDRILDRLKQLVGKDMKGCCDHLTGKLKELETDFAQQLKELKIKLNKRPTDKENPKREQELKNKLEKLKERMEQLEKNGKVSKDGKCCKEIENKLNELKNQVDAAKTGDTSAEQEKELKELETKVNDINGELEKRSENRQKVLENCEMQCGNETIGKEIDNDDTKRMENLEQMIKYLIENHTKLKDMLENVTQCKQLCDNALKNKEEEHGKPDNKICYESNIIQKAKDCCKDIDKLGKDNAEMREDIKHMNESYTENISKLNYEIKDLQNRLKEILEKPENASQQKDDKDEKDSDSSKNPEFDNKLDDINKKLDELQQALNDNDNKLKDVQQKSNDNFEELKNLLLNQKNAAEKFEKYAEQRYDELDGKINNVKPVDKADRMDRLETEQNQLGENIDKALELQKRVDDMKEQLQDLLDALQTSKLEAERCSLKCK